MNVTIYVAPGDYYLFNCFGVFVQDNACKLEESATDWCIAMDKQDGSLHQQYSKYDYIDYHYVNMCSDQRKDELFNPRNAQVFATDKDAEDGLIIYN